MSEDKNKSTDKNSGLILYIGGDGSFYQNIQENFKKLYPSVNTEFEQVHSDDEKIIQSYVLKIQEMFHLIAV